MDMHNDISDVPGVREAKKNNALSQYDVTARQLPEKTYYIDPRGNVYSNRPSPEDLQSLREEMKAAREG